MNSSWIDGCSRTLRRSGPQADPTTVTFTTLVADGSTVDPSHLLKPADWVGRAFINLVAWDRDLAVFSIGRWWSTDQRPVVAFLSLLPPTVAAEVLRHPMMAATQVLTAQPDATDVDGDEGRFVVRVANDRCMLFDHLPAWTEKEIAAEQWAAGFPAAARDLLGLRWSAAVLAELEIDHACGLSVELTPRGASNFMTAWRDHEIGNALRRRREPDVAMLGRLSDAHLQVVANAALRALHPAQLAWALRLAEADFVERFLNALPEAARIEVMHEMEARIRRTAATEAQEELLRVVRPLVEDGSIVIGLSRPADPLI